MGNHAPAQAGSQTGSGGPATANTQRLDINASLRRRYLQVEAQLQAAKAARDDFLERRCAKELKGIGEQIMVRNRGLVVSVARGFIANAGDLGDDYVAAGLEGLWEAFLKWDPDLGTLGNFSRRFIEGQVNREVRRNEYSEISYSDFSARKDVLATAERLSNELGHRPSDEEVAEASGHTVSLVERVRRPQATSLDAPTATQTTRGDLVAEEFDIDVPDAMIDELHHEYLKAVTSELTPWELFVYLSRAEVGDEPNLTLVELAHLTGQGREILRRCDRDAREKVESARPAALEALANRLRGH